MGLSCCLHANLEWIWSYVVYGYMPYFIAIYCSITFSMMWFAIGELRKVTPKNEADIKRDQQYIAFSRQDTDRVLSWYGISLFMVLSPFNLFRWCFGWSGYVTCWFVCKVLTLFKDEPDRPGPNGVSPFTGTSKKICKLANRFAGWTCLFAMGCFTIEEIEKDVDYEEYLGPNWRVPEGKQPGSCISNHVGYTDIAAHMYCQIASFVAKEATLKVPFIGGISAGCSGLHFSRSDKEQRKGLIPMISERQKKAEEGIYPPLIIHPEGGTSNGKYLLPFKIGAFAGLNSIQPKIFKYTSWPSDIEGCIIPVYANMMLMGANAHMNLKIIQLPIFKPNEFFFNKYQKDGEDKWVTYARVMRDIMAKEGDLTKSECSVEDKFVYKSLVYKTKINKD